MFGWRYGTALDCYKLHTATQVDSSLLESFVSQVTACIWALLPSLVLDHTLRLQKPRSSVSGSSKLGIIPCFQLLAQQGSLGGKPFILAC